MSSTAVTFDLAGLRLTSGEGRRFELSVVIEPFNFSGHNYVVTPEPVPVVLDISRMTGGGYALRLRFEAAIDGPCMRCLEPAGQAVSVDVREVSQPAHPGDDDDLVSDYLSSDGELQLAAWTHDAFALTLPAAILCREDCAGLCPECGTNLNSDPEHHHGSGPDPRWSKLSELKFDS